MGNARLGMWADITPSEDAEFNEWHNREHIPERVSIPGFQSGRRYRAIAGRPTYFMTYELEDLSVATSDAYLTRLDNPTPWTQRMTPAFHNFIRTAFRVTEHRGLGMGAAAAVLRLAPAAGRESELRRWLVDGALPAVLERPGIVVGQLWEADEDASDVDTAERALRDGGDAMAAWVLVVEGAEPGAVRTACGALLSTRALKQHGARGTVHRGLYKLLYSHVA